MLIIKCVEDSDLYYTIGAGDVELKDGSIKILDELATDKCHYNLTERIWARSSPVILKDSLKRSPKWYGTISMRKERDFG